MSDEDKSKTMAGVLKILESEVQLRSKRELIEKFIHEQMPLISSGEAVKESFDTFGVKNKSPLWASYASKKSFLIMRFKRSSLI